MTRYSTLRYCALVVVLVWSVVLAAVDVYAAAAPVAQEVKIGVLARRGSEQALRMWTPTADYLTARLPQYHFVIVPLDFDALLPAVKAGTVDFVLANSAYYVEMEARYGASRIATLRNRRQGAAYTRFGGAIFVRADRKDIRRLRDLRGKSFMAVDPQSLGGFLAAWRELKQAGIDPYRDFKPLRFGGTHDAVVYAVRDGVVAAGTVRTDTLERMAAEGKIKLKEFRVLNRDVCPGFAFLCSTRLYPEWPMARLQQTAEALGNAVATALLQMPPRSKAALSGDNAGWAVPANYQPVHQLMRALHVAPYRNAGRISLHDFLRQYWYWVVVAAVSFMAALGVAAYFTRLTRRLRVSEGLLRSARDELELRVGERTAELRQAMGDLEQSRRQIERTQRDWHDAFDAIPHPIFIHDKDLRIVHANPAYIARAGLDAAHIIGRPYWEVFPLGDGPLPACRNFPDQLQARGDEIELPGGEVFISQSFGVRHIDGTIHHAIHILEDVTSERRTEAQRRTLSHAVAQAGEGILVAGLDHTITYCNPALCSLLSGDRDAMQGLALTDIFPPQRRGEIEDILQHSAGSAGWMGEFELETQGGRHIPIFLTAGSIRDDEGRRKGFVFTAMDLSSIKTAEEALRYRLAFESLIGSIATHFVSIDAAAAGTEIRHALQQIGVFVGADRAYMFSLTGDDRRITDIYEWCADGVASDRERFMALPLSRLPWLLERIHRAETIVIPDVMELPREAVEERDELLAEGVRSRLMVPMVYGGQLLGFIGFDLIESPREWAKEDVRMLRAAGEIIANSVKRFAAEESVRRSETRLKEAQQIAHLGNWDWSLAEGTVEMSDEGYRIFGTSAADFAGNFAALLGLLDSAQRAAIEQQVRSALDGRGTLAMDWPVLIGSGRSVVHVKGQVVRGADDRPLRVVGTLQDVTEIRQAERELGRLNRALRTLSRGNEILVRASDEQQLLHDVCGVLTEVGGFRLAWVGYPRQDAERSIQPMAHAGEGSGYLEQMRFGWGDDEPGGCPAGGAIRSGQSVVIGDVATEAAHASWRADAEQRGYASIIALPLRYGTEMIGALTIAAADAGVFDAEEVRLLTELADDLAFGIVNLRDRAKRRQAERQLARSETRYHQLYDDAPNAYASVRAADGTILQSNAALAMLLGYSHEELAQMKIFQFYADTPAGKPRAQELFERFRHGEASHDVELQMRHKSGRILWVLVSVEPVFGDDGSVVESRSSIVDISRRKEAEEERKRIGERLQRALVQTIQAIAITIEKRDPYTAGHQQRVAELAVAIAAELGLSQERTEGLRLGALIHDIGKIYVPAEFLNRPGHLNSTELEIIQTHPAMGYDIVKGIEFPWPVADIVVQHHERLDGSGYPNGLKGDAIALEARILAVADVVEAMASHRPYRAALPLEMALGEIEGRRGVRYDPQAVDACLRLFREKGFQWDGKTVSD